MKANVLETIKKSAAVPSMPQVVLRFLELMRDPNFKYVDLAKVLSADAGTASEVLRLANSSLFGVRSKVVSLQHALTVLGPKRTRSMLLGRYLVDAMSQKQVGELDMSYFWRRSLTSSLVATHFADALVPAQRDEASMAALLADIGIPILLEAMPDAYARIASQYKPHGTPPTVARERKAVEVTHAEISAMVLAHWALPETITDAVNLHQSPNPGDGDTAKVARILSASDGIAKLLCEVPDADEVMIVCQEATTFIGADATILTKLLPTIEQDVEELADVLRIDVIPSRVYAMIAKTIEEQLLTSATR